MQGLVRQVRSKGLGVTQRGNNDTDGIGKNYGKQCVSITDPVEKIAYP
jgi:hypothetical protein